MEPIILSIMWIGQACFLVQTAETTILMDPVPARMGYLSEPIPADIVTISHEHFDHNSVELAKGEPKILRGLTEGAKDWNAVEFDNKDVKITDIPTYHDNEEGAKRGKNAMFLIETHGIRILHTGDLGHTLSEETLKKIGKVDILMICIGGFYTIDAKQAKEVVEQIKPRAVIPMHYKTDPKSELPISGNEDFLSGWKNVRRFEKSEITMSDIVDLPKDETTIVVLQSRKPAVKEPEPEKK